MKMSLPNKQELLGYLDQVITATSEGKFEWKSVNPTTYVWDSGNPSHARLTLQKVAGRNAVAGGRVLGTINNYLLQVGTVEAVSGGRAYVQKLKLDGATDSETNEKLKELFRLVSSGISQKGINFLREVLASADKDS
jgi:hypothetical protein